MWGDMRCQGNKVKVKVGSKNVNVGDMRCQGNKVKAKVGSKNVNVGRHEMPRGIFQFCISS